MMMIDADHMSEYADDDDGNTDIPYNYTPTATGVARGIRDEPSIIS